MQQEPQNGQQSSRSDQNSRFHFHPIHRHSSPSCWVSHVAHRFARHIQASRLLVNEINANRTREKVSGIQIIRSKRGPVACLQAVTKRLFDCLHLDSNIYCTRLQEPFCCKVELLWGEWENTGRRGRRGFFCLQMKRQRMHLSLTRTFFRTEDMGKVSSNCAVFFGSLR